MFVGGMHGELSSPKPEGKPGTDSSLTTWANLGLHYQQSGWEKFLRAVAGMPGPQEHHPDLEKPSGTTGLQ